MESDFRAKALDANTALCLNTLEAGMAGIGLTSSNKKRGHIGNVHRFHLREAIWFDALPAKAWILFYFSASASRVAGLDFARVQRAFNHANERKGVFVNVRLHDEKEAKIMVELIRSALRPST